ncbi:hypothetical protein D8Y22_06600 [Salinadaptatus halalkaliphilus]|uniref:Uncharacterized protein n=1 Tax=Salinadaptatus halalkaliphilus TaxID=2419781 RepID=A0A4S3TMV6_9EURY|nr:hypothetical protein [Salinadaptatus halalkaliphilus]THE65599.1 hypothetical protein D8Y22_06600 [Salinadaptatus halalkaliphilus]
MSDLLPDSKPTDEPDDELQEEPTERRVEDTPFTCVPWITSKSTGRKTLEQALEVRDEIQMLGEAYDDELEDNVKPFSWSGTDHTVDRDIVYWRYVGPTVATCSDVEWVGHIGFDESEGYPSFHELKDIAAIHLPDRAVDEYATPTARIVTKIGRLHREQNGRRVALRELGKYGYGPSSDWRRAYRKFAPLMPQIRPANGRNEPDWKWVKSD